MSTGINEESRIAKNNVGKCMHQKSGYAIHFILNL